MVILYNTFITPLRLSIVTDLPNDDPISLIDYVFDFIFLFDTLLHFYLPYTDPSTGSVVTDLAVGLGERVHRTAQPRATL